MKKMIFDNIINLDKVDSTNTYLKKYSRNLPDGTVVFAEEQTSGKGRLNRKWASEKKKSITCSFLVCDVYDNTDAIRLSFLFSISIKILLMKYIKPDDIVLKWPNDVLIKDKKICGILSEYSKECVVIGIGLNVLNFTPENRIDKPWTTLESETGCEFDQYSVKAELIECVNAVSERFCTNNLKDIPSIWFREAEIIDRTVKIVDGSGEFNARISGIDDNGVLFVENLLTGEIVKVSNGDIFYND